MTESRFFAGGTVPEHTTRAWYAQRDRAPHLEQAGHRERLYAARDLVLHAADLLGVTTVSDLGCGDGGLLSLLPDWLNAWGYDLQPANIHAAVHERHVSAQLADVLHDPIHCGELVVCTEFLEHLIDPHGFLRALPSRAIVASCPDSETASSHYEFHTWGWDNDGFRALLAQAGYEIRDRRRTPGFQLLLGARR